MIHEGPRSTRRKRTFSCGFVALRGSTTSALLAVPLHPSHSIIDKRTLWQQQRSGVAHTPTAFQRGIAREIGTYELEIRIIDPDILIGAPLALPSDHQR